MPQAGVRALTQKKNLRIGGNAERDSDGTSAAKETFALGPDRGKEPSDSGIGGKEK